MTAKTEAQALAKKHGLTVSAYDPGDGPKVRIHEGVNKDWFDSHPIFRTDSKPGAWKLALAFLEGYDHARI